MADSTITKYLAKIGAKGGRATSQAKVKASALNGKKGGRPKGSKSCAGRA